MTSLPSWNADTYKSSMQGIEQLAAPALEMLSHASGNDLLDLGCGDGRLTQILINRGYNVTAIDASQDMVDIARQNQIPAERMNAEALTYRNQFDVVFSHAVLHWVKSAENAVAGISRALRPDGLFIAQFGGSGDAQIIRSSLKRVMQLRGHNVEALDPWYNPSPAEYNAFMHAHRLQEVLPTRLIPWNYPLPDGMEVYVKTFFSHSLLSPLSEDEKPDAIREAVELMRPSLCDAQGNWHADFTRITVCAKKHS